MDFRVVPGRAVQPLAPICTAIPPFNPGPTKDTISAEKKDGVPDIRLLKHHIHEYLTI
jgi:hypothetical protein